MKNQLPTGNTRMLPEPLPHFPTQHQAVIWRNWGLVSPERLAIVLQTSIPNIEQSAAELGLLPDDALSRPDWLTHGYITIIRANWHLLPYEQLLTLLAWSKERLKQALLEEDFLFTKLGKIKPETPQVFWRELTKYEQRHTRKIKRIIEKNFPKINKPSEARPFEFFNKFYKETPDKVNRPPKNNSAALRMVYPYFAESGELLPECGADPLPETLLASYAEKGINAVWLHVILYRLYQWNRAPKLAEDNNRRIAYLNQLVERAARHGIGVYLYLNEPRGMPEDFFQVNPDLRGADSTGQLKPLCTSNPEIMDFVGKAVRFVFKNVPGLAGVFNINMSENPTHCFSGGMSHTCPKCHKHKKGYEVVAEINRVIAKNIHAVKPEARVIVWTWGWRWGIEKDWGDDQDWMSKAFELLPDNVDLMCTSEEWLPVWNGNTLHRVYDYSISQAGPGEFALDFWERAKQRGMRPVAKVQVNTSWECAALPYLPVTYLVYEHLQNLQKAGVEDLMLSWTLGGFPSSNMKLLNNTPDEIAKNDFGMAAAGLIKQAWHYFSNAFREFPFSISMIYHGPANVGSKTLLHLKATGLKATMVGFPFDDIKGWHGKDVRLQITPEATCEQFNKLSKGWQKGLDELLKAEKLIPTGKRENYQELRQISEAAYCHFRSCYLQYKFILLRENPENSEALQQVVEEELNLAVKMFELVRTNSLIGFEPTCHYFYTQNDFMEKVLNCNYVMGKINAKSKSVKTKLLI